MKEQFVDLFLKKKGFIHKNLELKKNNQKGYFFISNDEIKKNTILINVPKKLLIPVDRIKNLKNFDNEFEKKYFDTLIKNSQYLNSHPLNCKINEFKKIIEVLKNNENLKRNFEVLYEKYNLLNNEEKLIKLLELTR